MLTTRPVARPASGGEPHILKSNGRGWAAALAPSLLAVLATLQAAAQTTGTQDANRFAQLTEQPRISIAPAIVVEPASIVSLPIQIGPPEALPKLSFVKLRGLPSGLTLTVGHAIGPGSWAIALVDLPALKANIPAGFAGRAEIVIGLTEVDGWLLAEARTALVAGPPTKTVPATTASVEPEQKRSSVVASPVAQDRSDRAHQAAPRPRALSAVELVRAEQSIAQGDRYLAQGKVAGARLFFQQAADLGFAPGAIRLAATYDPAELKRLGVLGLTPDLAEARKWYERARALGAPEAEHRLARLDGK